MTSIPNTNDEDDLTMFASTIQRSIIRKKELEMRYISDVHQIADKSGKIESNILYHTEATRRDNLERDLRYRCLMGDLKSLAVRLSRKDKEDEGKQREMTIFIEGQEITIEENPEK